MQPIEHAMIWWRALGSDIKFKVAMKYFDSLPTNLTQDNILYIYNLGKKIYE